MITQDAPRQSAIRILIADDHPVVRDGLRRMLETSPDIEVVAEAGDGAEAQRLADLSRPDVVLVDLRMPGADGLAALEGIRKTNPEANVLLLSAHGKEVDVSRAIEAGARGYLLKHAPRDEIFDAVRTASRGENHVSPGVANILTKRMRHGSPKPLTEREVTILSLASEGASNKQIAKDLSLSEATVRTHMWRIFPKLDVPDRTAAVVKAIELGYLPDPDA